MMEYRKLPRGSQNEMFSTLGIGMGSIHMASKDEIEQILNKAIDSGINFFDMCACRKYVFDIMGKTIAGRRDKVFLEMHFGAVFNEQGDYGWSRDFNEIKQLFEEELAMLGTDYTDIGFLHCVDEFDDVRELIHIGLLDYIKELKAKGIVRHIGFSSHTPAVADYLIDTGLMDMMLFSINPAYDLEKGDEYGIGTTSERAQLLRKCEKLGIGISVMKPFHGGQLLDEKTSPFRVAMTSEQCIQYCLDRPGVLTIVPGVASMKQLEDMLAFLNATPQQKDYSIIGQFTPAKAEGNCVYCNHCQPCPAGIDVGLVNKYYDLALAGDKIAENHYSKLSVDANACLACGHCNSHCPFKVDQAERMKEIAAYFGNAQG